MTSVLHFLGNWKGAVLTGLVYLTYFFVSWLANLSSSSGPCTPGLGMLMLLLLPLVNILWLITDLFRSIREQNLRLELVTHTVVLVIWLTALYLS